MKAAPIMMNASAFVFLPARRSQREQGVVLIVALIMLVVIGLASVAIMRNVMSNDLVAENSRRQGQGMQAAQAALRYCEELVLAGTMTPAAAAVNEDAENWKTFSNWKRTDDAPVASGGPVFVAADFLNSGTAQSNRYTNGNAPRPQCMAQHRSLADGSKVIVFTARGFSDNFVADTSTGNTIAGAVVWLQSIIQPQ